MERARFARVMVAKRIEIVILAPSRSFFICLKTRLNHTCQSVTSPPVTKKKTYLPVAPVIGKERE